MLIELVVYLANYWCKTEKGPSDDREHEEENDQ